MGACAVGRLWWGRSRGDRGGWGGWLAGRLGGVRGWLAGPGFPRPGCPVWARRGGRELGAELKERAAGRPLGRGWEPPCARLPLGDGSRALGRAGRAPGWPVAGGRAGGSWSGGQRLQPPFGRCRSEPLCPPGQGGDSPPQVTRWVTGVRVDGLKIPTTTKKKMVLISHPN